MNSSGSSTGVDYGIITFKKEEFDALYSRFQGFKPISGRHRYYFKTVVLTRGGRLRTIVLARCVEQGHGEAQSLASDLIADLEPAWLLVVGIAGAVPAEEFGLGDVLLASRLHDFSVQAAIEGQAPELDATGGRVHPSVEKLLSIIPGVEKDIGPWNTLDSLGRVRPALTIPEDIEDDRYYGPPPWRLRLRSALRTRFREDPDTHRPLSWIGGVASSNTLVKDTQLVAEWKTAARSITHIEMELGGVYRAAWRPNVPVLSVRGISDVVGFRRATEWTSYACETAAAFTRALIASDLPFFDGASTPASAGPEIVDLSDSSPEELSAKFRAVEITWDVARDQLTPELGRQLLSIVSQLPQMHEVMVLRGPFASVKITVALTQEQITALQEAGESGALEQVGIRSAEIVPLDHVLTQDSSPSSHV